MSPKTRKDRKKSSRRPEQKLPGWREHLYLYDLHAFSAFFYLLCISSTESGVSNTKLCVSSTELGVSNTKLCVSSTEKNFPTIQAILSFMNITEESN